MTHPGQRLSALIDGELEAHERARVLDHVTRCASCRGEVAALRAYKQRMNALRAADAGAALTGRLIDLSDSGLVGGIPSGESIWPPPPPPSGWPAGGRSSPDGTSAARESHVDQRAGRLFLAGSVAIFLAGLGTAAVIAGGEPQARAPAPPVTPSVDVLVAPNNSLNQGPGLGVVRRESRGQGLRPDIELTHLSAQP